MDIVDVILIGLAVVIGLISLIILSALGVSVGLALCYSVIAGMAGHLVITFIGFPLMQWAKKFERRKPNANSEKTGNGPRPVVVPAAS